MVPSMMVTSTRGLRLTGRARLVERATRLSWCRRGPVALIVQVEEAFDLARHHAVLDPQDLDWQPASHWRDASGLDLAAPALRWLADLLAASPHTKV